MSDVLIRVFLLIVAAGWMSGCGISRENNRTGSKGASNQDASSSASFGLTAEECAPILNLYNAQRNLYLQAAASYNQACYQVASPAPVCRRWYSAISAVNAAAVQLQEEYNSCLEGAPVATAPTIPFDLGEGAPAQTGSEIAVPQTGP